MNQNENHLQMSLNFETASSKSSHNFVAYSLHFTPPRCKYLKKKRAKRAKFKQTNL